MKIIIVGLGKIGETILDSLVREGHDVTAVDINPSVISNITNVYDVICLCGNGTDVDTLTEAGAKDADMFVAVTSSDEFNMLACFLAKSLGAGHTVARIRTPDYTERNLGFIRQQLQLNYSINPEQTAAEELYRMIRLPQTASVEIFSRGTMEMVELRLKPDSRLIGLPLKDLRKKFNAQFLICAVLRDGEVYIPDGEFELRAGDKVGLTGTSDEIMRLFGELGTTKKRAKKVMMLGATRTSYYLAKKLLADGTAVTIIDHDHDRCLEFSEDLPGAMIVEGNGTEQEVLHEEGIESCDAFAALTGIDEENVLMSFYATSQGVPKVVTKINRKELIRLSDNLGLEGIVSPSKCISDSITRYARALHNSMDSNMETMYKLMDDQVEALEFIVHGDFKHLDTPIRDLPIIKTALLLGIIRGRRTFLPNGDDCIKAGDHVIVLVKGKRVENLTDIFC